MKNRSLTQPGRRRWAGNLAFLLVQIVVVSAAVAATVWRTRELELSRALPELRREPLRVAPQYDEPAVIDDRQLQQVLRKLEPRLRGAQPKINHVDHALRFWGVEAAFDDPQCLSGRELRELLLDHRRFAAAWQGKTPPLLRRDAQGVAVRTQEGTASASHLDHTLGGLAEVGTPLDLPLYTPEGEAQVRDLLLRSLRTFSLDQTEYEWSALAYILYLPPQRSFHTFDGQEITFDRLAERLMRESLGRGVCAGHHRLHALVMMLRVDEQQPILSSAMRERIVEHLRRATALLVQHQHPQGYWETTWAEQSAGDARTDKQGNDLLAGRILATGHALEWWALAPREVHPPRETLVRGGQWLARTIDELGQRQINENYTFLSHAGRALALWRGKFPAELRSAARDEAGRDADHDANNSPNPLREQGNESAE